MDVLPEFVDPEKLSTLAQVGEILEHFQQIFQKKDPNKFSKLKSFLSSCLALIQDKDGVAEL